MIKVPLASGKFYFGNTQVTLRRRSAIPGGHHSPMKETTNSRASPTYERRIQHGDLSSSARIRGAPRHGNDPVSEESFPPEGGTNPFQGPNYPDRLTRWGTKTPAKAGGREDEFTTQPPK